jgi:hypothetical protein
MYTYPNPLIAVSIGAPGRVTKLDNQRKRLVEIKDVANRFDGAVIGSEMSRGGPNSTHRKGSGHGDTW